MKKRVASLIALLLAAFISFGCKKLPEGDQILKFSADQAQPFFTTADKVLRPAASETPSDDECISKTVVLEIANVTKVALEFISDNELIDGLMFSVDAGDAQVFAPGVFYTKDTTADERSHSVVLKVWLSSEAPASQAGKSYVFTIKALAE